MCSLNHRLNHRYKPSSIVYKKHYCVDKNQENYKKTNNNLNQEKFVLLKNVWFSKEQNSVVTSMIWGAFLIGLFVGVLITLLAK